MEKNGNGDERQPLVMGSEVIRHRQFGHIKFVIADHAPMPNIGSHISQHGELNAIGLHGAFLESADALIIPGSERELKLIAHGACVTRLSEFAKPGKAWFNV